MGDVDGDGDLDLLGGTETGGPNGGLYIFKNNGSGVFTNMPQASLVGSNKSANTVSLGDVDVDGDLDALIGNRWGIAPKILINNGTGVFSNGFIFPTSATAIGSELIDIDADGDKDALIGSGSTIAIYTNNGAGSFTVSASYLYGYKLASKQYDLDADGDIDLVSGDNGKVNVYKNNGTGGFALFQTLTSSGFNAWGRPAVGDIDGDGDKDIYVPAIGTTDPDNIFANNGNGGFCKATASSINLLQAAEAQLEDFI